MKKLTTALFFFFALPILFFAQGKKWLPSEINIENMGFRVDMKFDYNNQNKPIKLIFDNHPYGCYDHRSYRVEYEYDSIGRIEKMLTYTDYEKEPEITKFRYSKDTVFCNESYLLTDEKGYPVKVASFDEKRNLTGEMIYTHDTISNYMEEMITSYRKEDIYKYVIYHSYTDLKGVYHSMNIPLWQFNFIFDFTGGLSVKQYESYKLDYIHMPEEIMDMKDDFGIGKKKKYIYFEQNEDGYPLLFEEEQEGIKGKCFRIEYIEAK